MSEPRLDNTRWQRGLFGLRWTILAIIAAGALLRIARLGSLPPALFRDEAEKAYTAYSILHTGRDASGHLLPLFINVFGVTTSAIYQYCTVGFVALLGLNEWSARLPAALAGIATILVTFALVRRERSLEAAWWTTLFLALSPWHIVFSRWAQQGILLPLELSGAMLAWSAFRAGRRSGLPVAASLFGLAVCTYDVARLFVPLFMLWLIALHWRELKQRWRETALATAIFALTIAPSLWKLTTEPAAANARFSAISIFQPGRTVWQVAGDVTSNYFAHFSPSFLLLHGDPELRHSPGVGVLTVLEFAGLLCGLVVLAFRRQRRDLIYLGWLVLFPVAASLTRVGIPHALRCIVALPAVQVVAGEGMAALVGHMRESRRRSVRAVLLLGAVLAFVPFAYSYFVSYSAKSAMNWQYGVKQALAALRPDMSRMDKLIFYKMTGAEYLVAFYDRLDPASFQGEKFEHTKYVFEPWDAPLEQIYAQSAGKNAYLMLPMFPGPVGGSVIELRPPGGQDPAAIVYLDASLAKDLGK
jgi:4-amino-4-deoxy-L-arabinose transferase-like glycosyltransferase